MRYLLILPVILIFFYWYTSGSSTNSNNIVSDTLTYKLPAGLNLPQVVYPDTALDQLSLFLAGLPQSDSNVYRIIEDSEHWMAYQSEMNLNWTQMAESRLSLMESWRDDQLTPKITEKNNVFYPFGGPDFLHAAVFYPYSNEFILAGLEPITEVPNLTLWNADEQNRYLDSLSISLRDIFSRSFFITRNMRNDLKKVSGVVPLFLVFIARTNHELLNLDYVIIDSVGNDLVTPFENLKSQTLKAVRIDFRSRGGGQPKRLYYFSGDISNPGLKSRKQLITFLNRRKPFNTFIKSASYLMHQDWFSDIRSIIIDYSETVFEDDTGIPYRYLKGQRFDGFFYGEYQKPVIDFEFLGKQADLDSAFLQSSQPLPFSLGYHWRDRKQNYMLFKKKNPIFVQ